MYLMQPMRFYEAPLFPSCQHLSVTELDLVSQTLHEQGQHYHLDSLTISLYRLFHIVYTSIDS